MSWKCVTATIISYSPAGVLFVWAAVLAEQNRRMSRGMLIFFLVLLGVAVVAAETARIYKRKKAKREHERRVQQG